MSHQKPSASTYTAFRLITPRTLERVRRRIPTAAALTPGQALVRLEAAAICGTDLPPWEGSEDTEYPAEVGFSLHECVGEIIQSNAPELQPGDRVLAMPLDYQGLREVYVTDTSLAMPIDKQLPATAAVLIQPLSTVLYAVERLGDVQGKSVLVIGLGSMGHLTAWLLKLLGAQVATVDPVSSPLQAQWHLAPHYAVTSDQLTSADLPAAPDIVVEVVGHQEQTILDAIRLVRRRGTVLLIGVPRPDATIPLYEAFLHNVSIVSSVIPPWGEYLAQAYQLVIAHHTELQQLITHQFPFAEAAAAYAAHERRADGRIKVALLGEKA